MIRQKRLKSNLTGRATSYDATRFFASGHPEVFKSEEEAQACWELIRNETMRLYEPIGSIDQFGTVEYGPWAWWYWDCPDAPFLVEFPEGLDQMDWWQHCQYEALVEWKMLSPTARDVGMQSILRTVAYHAEIYNAGREKFWRPWTTVKEKLDVEWQAIEEKIACYKRLGYLEEQNGKAQSKHRGAI